MRKKIRYIMAVVYMTAFLVACEGEKEAALFPLEKDIVYGKNMEAAEADASEGLQENTDFADEKVLVVHVCGAVKMPGVYELSYGSRSYDAVMAAGGFEADACEDYLNLARVLEDGMRLEIPTYAQVKAAREQGMLLLDDGTLSEGQTAQTGLININKADKALLCTLPGIGESRAESIIAYRQEHGEFQKKEDIMLVAGIKNGMYEKLESMITVGK
ncbi:MAG: hypothetical protein E7299_09530 [Lachnospiraceae bacterium]|nr:hypothetical protein [Lachnospiraceae bacterium]